MAFFLSMFLRCKHNAYNPNYTEIDDYFYGESIVSTFTEAREYCQSFGTELASIHSDQDFYKAKIKCQEAIAKNGDTGKGCWLGLTDIDVNGNYVWIDGTSSDYGFIDNDPSNPTISTFPWGNSQPSSGVEDCNTMYRYDDFQWHDDLCDGREYYPLCNKILDYDQETVSRCLSNDHSISAWYDGDSFNQYLNIWMDKSGNNNYGYIKDDNRLNIYQENTDATKEYWINDKAVISGRQSTEILFDIEINPENFTVINLCRYGVNKKKRILQTTIDDVVFGFEQDQASGNSGIGKLGIGYLSNSKTFESGYFITNENSKFEQNEWLFSTQQIDLYRGNFMDFTLDTFMNPMDSLQTGNQLHINYNVSATGGEGTFYCGEIIVSNDKLNSDELICMENYLQTKYNYTAPTVESSVNDSNEVSIMSPWYGRTNSLETGNKTALDQGRINGINDWGIRNDMYKFLIIDGWTSDGGDNQSYYGPFGVGGGVSPCVPFNLSDGDYITGYTVHYDDAHIYGLVFHTLLSVEYSCVNYSVINMRKQWGIYNETVSYYFGEQDFYYLTGFKANTGAWTVAIQFQNCCLVQIQTIHPDQHWLSHRE